ncbi:MBL fold metallo-hydrolase [Dysgonomonas sp. BGC7]|uniref:MBL fold metallo-hydrolase n=1 Tax=Dysgonomonas sp. BGC7 TaxID=1658008 RepID=UPI000A71B909|nr:MBL fold metallo-hydrolase [Dysgonomonas sp. BGC7]
MTSKIKKKLKTTMIITLSILGILAIAIIVFLNQANFGSTPTGERKERVQNSPNYRDGKFQNLSETPQLTGDKGMMGMMYDFLFGDYKRVTPIGEIPSVKTDLLSLDRKQDMLVWFGHSSYFIQIDGKRILVDPVLDGAASPVSFVNKPFKGSDLYKTSDIPDVDYLFISHDHWDHLDYGSVMALKDKVGKIVCGLGVGEHFEKWGFDKSKIIELDWEENAALEDNFMVYCLPSRHFSGRGLSPNQSLWASFLLQAPSMKIYIGGDSGYDTHFERIGTQFDEIDLAILENGQYGSGWKFIHMMPDQVVQAVKDLNAKILLPVHSSKFKLANHPWDEPLIEVTRIAEEKNQQTITPMIGEVVNLKDNTQVFSKWWVGIE